MRGVRRRETRRTAWGKARLGVTLRLRTSPFSASLRLARRGGEGYLPNERAGNQRRPFSARPPRPRPLQRVCGGRAHMTRSAALAKRSCISYEMEWPEIIRKDPQAIHPTPRAITVSARRRRTEALRGGGPPSGAQRSGGEVRRGNVGEGLPGGPGNSRFNLTPYYAPPSSSLQRSPSMMKLIDRVPPPSLTCLLAPLQTLERIQFRRPPGTAQRSAPLRRHFECAPPTHVLRTRSRGRSLA